MQHLKPTIKFAFIQSLPILSGFLFLGMAYGVYMRSLGFAAIYPIAMAFFIFAGSVEFVMASVLLAAFNPLSVLLLIGMISARQIFMAFRCYISLRALQALKSSISCQP